MPRSSSVAAQRVSTSRISQRNMMASLSFNGTNSSVLATKVQNLQLGCTFSAWFKYKPGTPPASIIENSQDTNNRLIMMYQAGLLRAGYWNGTAYTPKVSSVLTPNTWYHGVFTWDGTTTRLWLNGVEQLFTYTTPSSSAGGQMAIGMSGDGSGSRPFAGNIARAMIWNRPLTPDEVVAIYERGAVPTSGLMRKYDLNEGVGTVAYDTSGNGVNGTIANGIFTADTVYWQRQPVNRNLIYNGNFEYSPPTSTLNNVNQTWIDGTVGSSLSSPLFGWCFSKNAPSSAGGFDTTVQRSGSSSLKLSQLATGSSPAARQYRSTSTLRDAYFVPVLPNTSYTLTYWMKTQYGSGDSNGATINLSEHSNSLTATVNNYGTYVKTTTDWTMYTTTITTAASTRYLAVNCLIDGTAGAATLMMDAWFDDIDLRPTTPTSRQVIS